jgi:hypothetical protein
MPATWSTYQNAMKEVWTTDNIVSQLGVDNELFDRVEKTAKYTVGEYAIVPTKTSRAGGFTLAPNTGSSALNAAGNVAIGQPQYSLTYQYQPVKIEHAAIVSTGRQGVGRRERDRHRDGERRRGAQDADLASALRQR